MSTGSASAATCSAGPPTATHSFAVLDAYVEAGGNFIDTADTYMRPNMGISETIIGEWMAARGNRDSLVIATKVGSDGGLSAANIAQHVDESLARLQTDRIDLYYAHKDDGDVPVEETVRAFDQTVRDGKVLHVAASNVPPDRLRRVAGAGGARGPGGLRVAAAALQPVEREGYERDYAPIVERYGLSVAPYYALAAGFLTGKYRNQSADGSAREGMVSQLPRRPARRARPGCAGRDRADARRLRGRGRDRLAAGQAGHRRADRQRAHGRAAGWHPPDLHARPERDHQTRRGLGLNGRDTADLPG